MNAEELIIAHFDRSLSPEQETQLRQLLEQSPETRSLYERHEAIEGMIERESAALVPSDRLDEAVIASALGIWTQVAGGAGAWFAGKFAAGIATLAIGGLAVAVFTTSRMDKAPAHVQKDIPPAVLKLPALPPPAAAPVPQESAPAPTAEAPVTEPARVTSVAPANATSRPTASQNRAGTSSGLKFDKDPDVVIGKDDPAKIRDQKQK